MSIKEFHKRMEKIEYGYVDVDGEMHSLVDAEFADKYRLQSPKDLEKSKLGVCWD